MSGILFSMKIGLNIIGDIDPAADIGKVFRFFHRVDAQEIIGGNIEADGQIIEIIVSADDIALVVRRDAEAVSVWNIERETGEIVGKIDGSIAVIQCAEADSEFFEDIGSGFLPALRGREYRQAWCRRRKGAP